MKKLMFFILIIIAALGEAQRKNMYDFKWITSPLFPNGTVVQACVGDNVTFPWKFDMTLPQEFGILWSKTSEIKLDQRKHTDLASYNRGTFYGLSPERDVEFLPNAGIKLPKVTLADKGVYTVEIIVSRSHTQVAFLNVYDVPMIASDQLHAFILPERVYNSTTGLRHVQLGCRLPETQGQSALSVIWTTPSNRTAISTSYNNNTFILALPSPMEEGDYSCSLNWSVPVVKCLNTYLNTRQAATVNVKGLNARSVETPLNETSNLNGSMCNLSDIVQHLQTNDKKCDEEIININQTTENIYSVLQNLQTKNDDMSSKINYLESITANADIKYGNMSVMVLNKFDNLTDVIQRKNCCMTDQIQSNFDAITAMVQRINDSITAMVQRNNDNIKDMVQRNNDNIKDMVQSKFDNITAIVKSKFDNITAMVQRNNDNVKDMVQSKFDIITSMVQSKFDNVNAIALQTHSGLNQLLKASVQRPASCVDVQKFDNVSGVRTLYVNDYIGPVKVYCDQSTDNGGWTVIQRRQDGSVDFYRNWEQYEKGFGDAYGEYWIGLDNLHQLTKSKTVKLRIDLTDFNGSTAYAIYNPFSISGADDSYRLHVGGYSGTAGDSLTIHNEMKFTTFDRDHDSVSHDNCAKFFHGAWWYRNCHNTNLNGRYKSDGGSGGDGIVWSHFKPNISLKRVEMKIKELTLN